MAERVREGAANSVSPRIKPLAGIPTAQRFPIDRLWSRESLLRLGLSFVLALALWLYITSKQDTSHPLDFPSALQVRPINYASGLVVTNSLTPVRVSYRLDNPATQVTTASFTPVVDLAGIGPGLHRHVPISIEAEPGVNIAGYSPRFTAVELDQTEKKSVAIRPKILTNAPAGYSINSLSITPNIAIIQGPGRLVKQVASATVELNLSGVTSSLDTRYLLTLETARAFPLPTRRHSPSRRPRQKSMSALRRSPATKPCLFWYR